MTSMKKMISVIRNTKAFKESVILLRPLPLPQRLFQHLYFRGPFKVRAKEIDIFWINHLGTSYENNLFWSGLTAYEPTSIEAWKVLSKQADTVIDGGANTGLYSLVAGAASQGRAKVIAFEPVDFIFSRLADNVNINHFDIKPVCAALSKYDSLQKLYITAGDHPVNCSLENAAENEIGTRVAEVRTFSLDSYALQAGLEKIDLIKLDLEGHEPKALGGATRILSRSKPTILIEVNTEETGKKIQEILDEYSYSYYLIDEGYGLVKTAFLSPPNGLKWGQNFLALVGDPPATLSSMVKCAG